MSANAPALRLVCAATLFLLAVAAPARAEYAARLDIDDTAALARLDGRLRPVEVRGTEVSVHFGGACTLVLRVVDLTKEVLPATAVDFSLARDQRLRLEVLDLEGNLVRTLAEGLWAAGNHQLAWQHDADSGDRLDRGLYVVRLVPEAAGDMVALER